MDKYCVFINNDKNSYWTVEDRRSGKTMLPFGINDSILISHPSYSGYFQDEAKNESSTRRCLFLGWNQTKTKLTKWLCTFLHRHWEFVKQISLLYFWKGDGNSEPKKIILNIDGEACTSKWVLFHSFFDIY